MLQGANVECAAGERRSDAGTLDARLGSSLSLLEGEKNEDVLFGFLICFSFVPGGVCAVFAGGYAWSAALGRYDAADADGQPRELSRARRSNCDVLALVLILTAFCLCLQRRECGTFKRWPARTLQ